MILAIISTLPSIYCLGKTGLNYAEEMGHAKIVDFLKVILLILNQEHKT